MTQVIKTTGHGQVTIQYIVQGTGVPIIILPSLGRGQSDYDHLARLLQERKFRIIRPHPRGILGSQGPMENLTMDDLAADIASVIKAEGAPDAVLAGHAMGNFIARKTATVYPELVRGVALLAASAGKTPSGEPSIPADVLESVAQSGNLVLGKAERIRHLQKAFFAPGNDCHSWLDGWYPQIKGAQWAAWQAAHIDTYFAAGTAPILDLQAEQDTVAPRRFSQFLKSELGDRVTVKVICGAGHALIPEQPEAVCSALASWAMALRPVEDRA